MSLTTRILLALAAGLGAGVVISFAPALEGIVPLVEPVGALWIGAIRMTVIPLVVASIIVGVASASDPRQIGRIGGRAIAVFAAVLLAAGVYTVLVAPPLLALLPFDAEAAAALRASAASVGEVAGTDQLPTFAQWLVALVPPNPFRAASDGALLPLIVFSIALGLAATRLAAERRRDLVAFFQALAEAMLVLVRWVLDLAPIGVFALALALGTRMGIAAAGAVASYIAVVSLMSLVFIGALYPVAASLGRTSLRRFAHAAAPAQSVAFSSRSSLASLPAMIDGAIRRMGLPAEIGSFFLPLAASTFRAGGVIGQTCGVLFIAHLYGVDLAPVQLATIGVASVLTSFSVPGVPGGSILVMVPVLLAADLPVEGIGILLAVDTIPDMFRTTANVTGSMTAAAIVGRPSAGEPAPAAAPSREVAAP